MKPARAAKLLPQLAAGAVALWVAGATVQVAHAEPGEHIQAGSATITPELDLGVEFRTNVRRDETEETPGANVRVAPGVTVDLSTPQTDFSLGGEYELRKYFGDLSRYDRFNDFRVDADLNAGKQQALGLKLGNHAVLRNLDVANSSQDPFNTQLRNSLNGLVVARPGPVLDIGVGGLWTLDDYRLPGNDGSARKYNTRNAVGPQWEVQWRFFPRTAVVLEGSYQLNRWAENSVAGVNLPNSNFFRLLAGMRGRLTERVVLIAMLGYGSGKYTDDNSVAGLAKLLAQAQLKYTLSPGRVIEVGYIKDFEDSYFTNYLTYNRVFARFDGRIGSRAGLLVGASLIPESYTGDVTRNDLRIRGEADFRYHIQDWASITSGVWYNQRASDDSGVEYKDVNIHVLGTFTY